MRRPQKGGRPSREVAGRRRVAAGVNARPTSGREVRGRGRESAAAEGAAAQDVADVCIQIFILLLPKQKEERRHKPKLFGNNCLLFTN